MVFSSQLGDKLKFVTQKMANLTKIGYYKGMWLIGGLEDPLKTLIQKLKFSFPGFGIVLSFLTVYAFPGQLTSSLPPLQSAATPALTQFYIWLEDSTVVASDLEVLLPGQSPIKMVTTEKSPVPIQSQITSLPGFALESQNTGHQLVILFSTPSAGFVHLEAYEADGRKIGTLYTGYQESGPVRVRWPFIDQRQKNSGLVLVVAYFQGALALKQWVSLSN